MYRFGLKNDFYIKYRNGLKIHSKPGLFGMEHVLFRPYRCLEDAGKIVIDVGTFAGDTAIYFSLSGAKKIYAFEPYPYAFEVATENLKNNGITNVELHNVAIGAEDVLLRSMSL
jgi:ribosomal protein L11 methylase PrmA